MRIRDLSVPFWAIIALQVLTFAIFVLPKALFLDAPPIQFLLILSEIALLVPLLFKLPRRFFYLIWEVQVFLLIMTLVIFDFERTFQIQNPSPLAVRSIAIALVFIEVLILLGFILREKAVKPILISLSSITSISVVVIVIFIVSEGHQAFIENDPVDFIIGDRWSPFYQEPLEDRENLTIDIKPYEFAVRFEDELAFVRQNETVRIALEIKNLGPLNDSYSIRTSSDDGIPLNVSEDKISLSSGMTISIIIEGVHSDQGSYGLTSEVVSENSTEQRTARVKVVVGDRGVNMLPESSYAFFSGYDSPPSLPLVIKNTGSVRDRFLINVSSSKDLNPVVQNLTTSWDYLSGSAFLDLGPNETVNCWINPIITRLSRQDYPIKVTVRSLNDSSISDAVSVVYGYKTFSLFHLEQKMFYSIPGRRLIVPIEARSETQDSVKSSLKVITPIEGMRFYLRNENATIEMKNGELDFDLDDNSTAKMDLIIQLPDDLNGISEVPLTIYMIDEGSTPAFGIGPLIVGTMLTTVIALIVAVPFGLSAAIFLAEYCPLWLRRIVRPLVELLAGIPSIIYGLWGYLIFGPFLMDGFFPFIDGTLGRYIPFLRFTSSTPMSGETVLTAGFVLAIMILPIIITLSEDSIRSVPRALKEGGNALGTTKWQTIRHIVIRKASSGIISSIILAMGRAIGETMAVVMIMKIYTRYPDSLMEKAGSMTAMIAGVFGWSYDLDLTRHAIFGIATILFFIVFILNIIVYRIQLTAGKRGKRTLLTSIVEKTMAIFGKERKVTKKDFSLKRSFESFKDRMSGTRMVIFKEHTMKVLLIASTFLIIMTLFFILGNVLYTGFTTLTLEHFLEKEVAGGIGGGGYNNAMVGSILLTLLSLFIAVPLSLGTAIYVQQYAKETSIFGRVFLFTSDTLASTPSIVFGAFGFIFFSMFLEFRVSMLAAALTLALMAIPLLLRSSIEALKSIPKELGEASLALGATKWQTVSRVILPPAMGGISSGIILGIGRVIGETAAILFTAGYAFGYARSIMYPVATMPSMIYSYYDLAVQYPELWDKVYSAAFVLILIVLVMNSIARIIQVMSSRMSGK